MKKKIKVPMDVSTSNSEQVVAVIEPIRNEKGEVVAYTLIEQKVFKTN